MKKKPYREMGSLALLTAIILVWAFVATCGGGGGGGSSSTGTVNTSISDPPTCQPPNGPFQNVWVTITRVRAHTSTNANPNGNGWAELVDLRNSPLQIDLLNLESTACVLAQLGSKDRIPAGQYQQIRLYLMSNEETLSSANNCGPEGNNCVVLAGGEKATLNLSSEAHTGIKIPSGQIAGGKFTVLGGQTIDLNIDFDACSSIVQQVNGQYRLKPVLHAGEVSLTNLDNNSISGRVITTEDTTITPVPNAIVLVEMRDTSNPDFDIDRVLLQKTTGDDGKFIFCSLSPGTYDVVAAANNSKTYNATVTLSVPLGTNIGDIPLVPEDGGTTPAQIKGRITSAPNSVDVSLSALQLVPKEPNPLIVTIPLFAGSNSNLTTETSQNCEGTICADYTLYVPASNPQWGTFPITSSSPYIGPAPTSDGVFYWVNAQAFVPGSGSTPDCTSPSLPLTFDSSTRIEVKAGKIATPEVISFAGCDGQ
jgi:hypothetical protein